MSEVELATAATGNAEIAEYCKVLIVPRRRVVPTDALPVVRRSDELPRLEYLDVRIKPAIAADIPCRSPGNGVIVKGQRMECGGVILGGSEDARRRRRNRVFSGVPVRRILSRRCQPGAPMQTRLDLGKWQRDVDQLLALEAVHDRDHRAVILNLDLAGGAAEQAEQDAATVEVGRSGFLLVLGEGTDAGGSVPCAR